MIYPIIQSRKVFLFVVYDFNYWTDWVLCFKKSSMNVLGYFIFKFKCRDSSGNFSIPLKTEFVDARGTAARMFKKIMYG